MIIEEGKRKQLIADRNAINKEISKLNRELKREELESNVDLYDKMMLLPYLYDNGDLKQIRNVCESISTVIGSKYYTEESIGEMLEKVRKLPEALRLPAGFGLNDIWIRRGIYFVLCARTGVGKTTAACNIAVDCILKKSTMVFYTLEMSKEQIWSKIYMIYMKQVTNTSYGFGQVSEFMRVPEVHKNESIVLNQFMKDNEKYIKLIIAWIGMA